MLKSTDSAAGQMSAEIIPLFDPKARVLMKRQPCVDMGIGLGVGPQHSSADIDWFASQLRVAMHLSVNDNHFLKSVLSKNISPLERRRLLEDLSTIVATARIVRRRIIAAAETENQKVGRRERRPDDADFPAV